MKNTKVKGFTLIELLVVIAIIALLLSVIVPSLGKAKIYAQKVTCASNLRQQCLGTMLYTEDYDGSVPYLNSGFWLWDVTFHATNELSRYGGFDHKIYFCPANRQKKAEDARFWQYGWVDSGAPEFGPAPYRNALGHRDESSLTSDQLNEFYRVMPNIYTFQKYDPADGRAVLPTTLITGQDADWISKLSRVKSSGSKVMVMDVVMNKSGEEWNFFNIDNGGIVDLSGDTLMDSSNHSSRQTLRGTGGEGPKPDGGNIGFADGHVSWRRFDDMQARVTWGQTYWW